MRSHLAPTRFVGSMTFASAMAPAPLSPPAPCASGSNEPRPSETGIDVNSRTALSALGVRPGLTCRTSATSPLATPAAMLVPLNRMYCPEPPRASFCLRSTLPGAAIESSPCPGAATSGFANPSYHEGPREL